MVYVFPMHMLKTAWTLWPSGLRRWLKAPFRKGVGSNPTGVIRGHEPLAHEFDPLCKGGATL